MFSKKTKQNIQELKEQRKNMIEDYRTSCDESDQKTNKLLRNINSKKLNGKIRLSIKYRQQKQELIDLLKKISKASKMVDFPTSFFPINVVKLSIGIFTLC